MATEQRPGERISGIGWWAAALALLVGVSGIVAIATAAVYDNPYRGVPPLAQDMTVSQIVSNMPAHLGKQVTVVGRVAQVVSPEALSLANQGTAPTTNLLVVGKPNTLPKGLKNGDSVRVMGTLRSFTLAQVEKELGVTLDQKAFAPYEGKPVVVAKSIAKAG